MKNRPNFYLTPSLNGIGFELQDSGLKTLFVTTAITNKWYFIVEIHQGISFIGYVFDSGGLLGTAQRNDIGVTTFSNSSSFIAGIQGWWGGGQDSHYQGLADDIRIYNRAPTDTEVQALYNSQK